MGSSPPDTQVLDILFNETEGLLRDETPVTLPLPDLDTISFDYYYNNITSCAAATEIRSLSTSPKDMRDNRLSVGENSDSGISLDEIPSPEVTSTLQRLGSCDHNYTLPNEETNIDMDFHSSLFLDDFCFDDLNLKLGDGPVDSSVVNPMLSVFDGMDFLGSVDSDFHVDFADLPLDLLATDLPGEQSPGSPIEESSSPINVYPTSTDGHLSDPGSDESADSDIITSTTDVTDCHTPRPISANRIIKIITVGVGGKQNNNSTTLPFTVKDVHSKPIDSAYPDLRLSEEEKQLLAQDGVVLPTNMPLTKDEERALKSVRRKIRNKISAKTSRKRKMEYVDGLEKRVKLSTVENSELRKKVHTLEHHNSTLLTQLKKLQALVSTKSNRPAHTTTCIMVLALSFMFILLPSYNPLNMFQFGSSEIRSIPMPGNSRSLLHKPDDMLVPSTSADDPYGTTKWPIPPWDHPDSTNTEPIYMSIKDDESNKPLIRVKRGFVFGDKEAQIETYRDSDGESSSSLSKDSLLPPSDPAQENKTDVHVPQTEDKLSDPTLPAAMPAFHINDVYADRNTDL